MPDRFRIAVVGGSVAGCAVAVELSRAGHEVTVFERSATALSLFHPDYAAWISRVWMALASCPARQGQQPMPFSLLAG